MKLGHLYIRAKLVIALVMMAVTGALLVWGATEELRTTQAQLLRIERALGDLRQQHDNAGIVAPIERAVQSMRNGLVEAETEFVISSTILLATAFVLALTLLWIGVAGPIRRVSEAARNLARGDLWTDLPDDIGADEAGGLANALKSLKRAIIEHSGRADVAEQKARDAAQSHAQAMQRDRVLAEGIKHIVELARQDSDHRIRDLETALNEAKERERNATEAKSSVRTERREHIAKISLAFERAVFDARLSANAALDKLLALAEQVGRSGTAALESHAASAPAAAAVAESLVAAEKRADSFAVKIREIVDTARSSAKGAAIALGKARTINRETQALVEAAQKIGEIIGVMQAIAQRTQLVALNASIEVTRAGFGGKPFQSIVDDIKGLSNQTASATTQVTQQVTAMQERVARSVDVILGMGDAVGRIAVAAEGIATTAEQESVDLIELGHHLDQAMVQSQSAARSLRPFGAAATGLTQSIEAMRDAAAAIREGLATLERDIGQYIAAVRED